jgi:hypothetical protein
MKLKQGILSVMGRDALRASIDEWEIEGADKSSAEDMRSHLSRARRATPESLLAHLNESDVKKVCELMDVSPKGRRTALVNALFDASKSSAVEPKAEEVETETEDETTHWQRPEEIEMTDQSTVDRMDRPFRFADIVG